MTARALQINHGRSRNSFASSHPKFLCFAYGLDESKQDIVQRVRRGRQIPKTIMNRAGQAGTLSSPFVVFTVREGPQRRCGPGICKNRIERGARHDTEHGHVAGSLRAEPAIRKSVCCVKPEPTAKPTRRKTTVATEFARFLPRRGMFAAHAMMSAWMKKQGAEARPLQTFGSTPVRANGPRGSPTRRSCSCRSAIPACPSEMAETSCRTLRTFPGRESSIS